MKSKFYTAMPAVFLLALLISFLPKQATAQVVISQIYGGGGNTGATYTNDFVELFNRGTIAQNIAGWSIQYASATGTSWTKVNISSGNLQPGQYYLIQLQGGATGVALPTADLSSTSINMAAGQGKLALISNQTTITSGVVCPVTDSWTGLIDFVGWGTANCSEGGSTASGPSNNTTSALRLNNGCTDTNVNSSDFASGSVNPRNTSTALNPCQVACIPPVITCPGNILINNAPGQCGANVTFAATATGTSPTITFSHASGSFFPVGATIVTATATNACGSDQCTFTITVTDAEPPAAICQNVVLSLDANGAAVLTTQMVDNGSTDNCTSNPVLSLSRTNFSCADIGAGGVVSAAELFISEYLEGSSNNKCIEIFNGTGSSVDLTAGGYQLKIYANGAIVPNSTTNLTGVISPGDVFVICNTSATSTFINQADQLSGNMSFNGNDAVELFKSSTNQTIDIFGRIGEDPGSEWGSGLVSTMDNTLRRKPGVSQGITTNPGSGFPTLSTEWDGYATDNADNLGSHVFSPGGSGIPVILTVTDAAGNSSTCTAGIIVVDNSTPTSNCHQNINVYLDATGNASITPSMVDNGSTDNCSSVQLSLNQNSFNCNNLILPAPQLPDLIISEYVEGSSFNKYIEIYNNTGSAVNLSNYELRLYSNGSATPTTTSNLGLGGILNNSSTVVFKNTSATIYPGTSFVLSAVNYNGDDAVELFNLSLNQPADIFGAIGEDPGTEWGTGLISTADNTLRRKLNVTQGVTVSASGFPTLSTEWDGFVIDDISGLGTHGNLTGTNVILTVTDASGNSSTCSANITVIDNIAPQISGVGQNLIINCIDPLTFSSPTATDNCSVTSFTFSDNIVAGNCPVIEIITRTWTATDASGNSSTASQTISVIDNTAPAISGVGANATIECPATPVFSSPTVSDDCDANPILTFSDVNSPGNCINEYSVTRTWTATDACGNFSTASVTIFIIDDTPPTIICPADVIVCANEPVILGNAAASDDCGTVVITHNAPVVFPAGTTIVTWTATDECGNSSTCTQNVTVHLLNALISVEDVLCYGESTGSLTVLYFAIPAANPSDILYSLDGGTTTQASNIFNNLPAGNYNITLINTASNCTTTVSTIISQPSAPLTVTTSSTNTCPGGNTGTLTAVPTGGAGGYIIEWEDALGIKIDNPNGVGAGTYTVIVTDANDCTVTGTVTVNEHSAPTVSLGPDKVVFYGALGHNGCHTLTANATGNGPFIYAWTATDPNPVITTVSGSNLNVCVTSDVMYTYTVIVTDANGCTASASINVIYTNIDCSNNQNSSKVTICRVPPGNPQNCQTMCVAVSAAQALINTGSYVGPCLPNCAQPPARLVDSAPLNSDELNLYPNPASGFVNVEYKSETNNAETILITDLQGRIFEEINIFGAFEFHGDVDVSKLENGIYFVNIMSKNSVLKTAKLIKTE